MKELKFALKQTFPIFFTYIFIGIAFGIMMNKAGESFWYCLACGVFIYAGSMQIVMVPLIASGASLFTLALTAFIVNARHIFYGLGFIETFKAMKAAYPYMIFSLTDETYSIFCYVKYEEGMNDKRAAFLIAFINHLYWIAGCAAGSLAGELFTGGAKGIEFSATAFFLVVAVNQFKQYPSKLPAAIGCGCALLFLVLLGAEAFLIPALCASIILLLVARRKVEGSEGKNE